VAQASLFSRFPAHHMRAVRFMSRLFTLLFVTGSKSEVTFLNSSIGATDPIGHGTDSAAFNGFKDVYLASGDPLGELLHILLTLGSKQLLQVDNFVSVVGSFEALNLLAAIQPKNIYFFDFNPAAVSFAKMKVELVTMSHTPQEYISRLFARNVTLFEDMEGRLTNTNQEQFVALPVDQQIRDSTLALLSKKSATAYSHIMVPRQDPRIHKPGWNSNGALRPCNVRHIMTACAPSGLGPQPQHPGDSLIGFQYGEGFLSNQNTFNALKRTLRNAKIHWAQNVDFPHSAPLFGMPATGSKTLVFVMDMFASNYASTWPLAKQKDWHTLVGKDNFVLMQTICSQRQELVQEFDGSSWTSLSNWDSSPLMPSLVCGKHHGDHWRPCCSKLPSSDINTRNWVPQIVAEDMLMQYRAEKPAVSYAQLSLQGLFWYLVAYIFLGLAMGLYSWHAVVHKDGKTVFSITKAYGYCGQYGRLIGMEHTKLCQ